jgi:hypothetical protein
MTSLKIAVAVALALATAAIPLSAQDRAAEAAAPVPAACELHVWPSSPVRSSSNNYFVQRSIVDGAVQGRDGYTKLPEDILGVQTQLRTLGELDIAGVMQLHHYSVVLHDQPLPSRVIRTTQTRLDPESPPCYAELVTDDVFFQQDVIDGRFLKAIFRFRQFDNGSATPSRSFGTYVQYRLTQFPPKEPGQVDAALEEFRKAYGEAVKEFGIALNKPAKGKKVRPKK